MEDIDLIKKRIQERKGKKLTNKHFNYFFGFHIFLMIVIISGILYFTYQKQPEIINKVGNVLKIESLKKYFDPFFDSKEVTKVVEYELIEGNYYTNNTNKVESLENGTVLFIGNQQFLGSYIVIQGESGIITTYGLLEGVNYKQNDKIKKGDLLGTYNNQFMLVFEYQGSEISYEKARSYY